MQAEVRRLALPAIAAYRGRRVRGRTCPSPELAHEMMSFLACAPVDERVVPMFLDDLHLDGADSGAIMWGDEIPDDRQGRRPRRGDRLRRIRAPRRHPAGPGRPAVHHRREERRARAAPGGTTATRVPGSTSAATSTATRSSRPTTGASTSSGSPSCATTSPGSSTNYDLRPHCRFGTEVTARDLRRGDRALAGRRSARADGTTDTLDARFVISGVGALNQPKLPDIPGMDDFAGPSFHSARWDPDVDWRGTRFALVGAGASGFQIAPDHRRRGRAPDRVPAHRAVDVPERQLPPRRCPPATPGPCATCRSTAGGSAS